MKRNNCKYVNFFGLCISLTLLIYSLSRNKETKFEDEEIIEASTFRSIVRSPTEPEEPVIPLVMVMCKDSGDMITANVLDKRFKWTRQKEQFLTMISSMLHLSDLQLINIVLFSDSIETFADLISLLESWPPYQRKRLRITLRDLEMERFSRKHLSQWRPCAWAKMFLPEMLPDYDSAIYLDTDTVFLGPVEDLWNIFDIMNENQSIAAAPELWYLEEGDHRPIGGKYGLNTGVLGLNLTRLRTTLNGGLGTTLQRLPPIEPDARHDQDVLNFFLKNNPSLLLELPARYNFLPSSCLKFAPICTECLEKGILVLHGADSIFYRLVDAKSREVYRELQLASTHMRTPLTTIADNLEHRLATIEAQSPHLLFMCQHHPQYDYQLMLQIRNRVTQLNRNNTKMPSITVY